MSLNVATLEAALPASLTSALTVITSASQVYVGDEQRVTSQTSPQALWQRLGVETEPAGIAEVEMRWTYLLRVEQATGWTAATFQVAAREIVAAYHHSRNPNVTGMRSAEVRSITLQTNPGETGAQALEAVVVFSGVESIAGYVFDPASISGLVAHFDSSLESAGSVASLANLVSGGVPAAVTATGTAQPTATAAQMNGRTALVFDGTTDTLRDADECPIQDDAAWTIFVVASCSTLVSGNYWPLEMSDSGTAAKIGIYFGGSDDTIHLYVCRANGTSQVAAAVTYAINTTYVICARATAANARSIMVNGTESTDTVAVGSTQGTLNRISVGSNEGTQFLPGIIGEILIYSGALSDADRTTVLTHLNSKWRGV